MSDLQHPPDQRGNMLLRGDDAKLYLKLCVHLTIKNGKQPQCADIIREAIRLYAANEQVTLEA
jgi:hypothetical protein